MSLALALEPKALEANNIPITNSVLYLDGVSVSFDGFKALNNLSLMIGEAEMRAVIGPNGAGKTTMMDVITGKTRPDTGTALYDRGRRDLLQMDVAQIADAGIGRKFQKPSVFESQTVGDNILLALKGPRGAFSSIFGARGRMLRNQIAEVLERVSLADAVSKPAGGLSHGQKQWLEIGMLLAQDPKLLLVDEPVAGMTDAETEATADLLKDIAKTRSVVVVEHDMTFVRALGVKVTCLHEGSVLAEGALGEVSSNPRVIEVYLGR